MMVFGADCSIVVVCTHGVRVVRVRFPAVRLGWDGAVSSAGRALAWHARGQRFDSATVHRIANCTNRYIVWGMSYSIGIWRKRRLLQRGVFGGWRIGL